MAPAEAFEAVISPRNAGRATTRRLIINADDFGRSAEINAAVIRAHTEGVLTSASLMVNEDGFEEAVALARLHPRLGVGLHLALVCGRAALSAAHIPGLVDSTRQFAHGPLSAGIRFFFQSSLQEQLRAEITAQFEKFQSTGLALDHVNGHLHFHLHPTVLPVVLEVAARYNARAVRLTHDPLRLNARIAGGNWLYRLAHATIFAILSRRAARHLRTAHLRHTGHVFGLLQDSRVDEQFVLRLLSQLPPGDSELYSHPSLAKFKHELDALLSPKVKRLIAGLDLQLIRYQDL
jgi:chitin disaccharide deacetylase